MKLTKIILIVAAASFAAGSALAQEPIGEPSYLGMKRRYVPAPAPVPETFNWYIRADIGVGITAGDASDHGSFGNGGGGTLDNDFWAATSQRINWFDSSSDPFFQGGIGFGKYLSPRFRMDVTLDFKSADKYEGAGSFSYAQVNPPPPPFTPTGDTVTVTGIDQLDVIDGVTLINAYLDLVPRGQFTPYIGLGAGFATRIIDRTHHSEEEVSGGGSLRTWDGTNKDIQFAPALSATAGLAWAITPGTILDVNYRYTYIGSVDTSMMIVASDASVQRSKITVSESHQHAIRAGLRWNIW
jgi:opacity protein-like surface antigen